jgi:hypothetical protein
LQPIQERNLFKVSLDVHGIDWVVVFAYFDRTRGGAHDMTAVAGYLFDNEGAAKFIDLYKQNVEPMLPPDKHGKKIFHAASLFDRDDQFSGMERPIRECVISRMAEAIRDCVTVGIVVGIENTEYQEGLKGRYIRVRREGVDAKSLEPWVGSKYSLCLLRAIHGLNTWLDEQNIAGPIQYAMEAEEVAVQEQALAILARLHAAPKLRDSYRIGGYAFWPKSPEIPWLFAADYFGWWWQFSERVSANPEKDWHGDWESPVVPLIENKPHLASYLTEASVGTQALVNAFYGLMKP